MPAPLYVPIGERVSLGVGKETTFGSPVTPTIFLPVMDFNPTPKNTAVPRTSARGQNSQVEPATGSYVGKISMQPECCPDVLPPMLAWAMGSQSTPTTSVVNTTVTASAAIGATSITVASAVNISAGVLLTCGTNPAIAVASVAGLVVTLQSALTVALTIGAAVVCTSTTAYSSTIKLGSPLPTLTLQNDRVTDAIAYAGCKIDTFKLMLDSKKGLTGTFTLLNQNESKVTSPATPAFSALFPFQFETIGGSTTFNGTAIGQSGAASVLSWEIDGTNTIDATYYSAAQGRFPQNFPEQMKKITGKATLGFENDVAQQAFWGGSTGPASHVPSIALNLFLVSTDLADATNGVPYSLNLYMAKCFIESADVAQKPGSILQQVVTFECAQSAAGNSDDLVATFVNTNATVY